jgi:hypothetical protein
LRALTPIALTEPTALYRGEILTFHHALVAPDGAVFVFCGTGDREVMLFQVPVANGQSVEFSRVAGGGTAGFRGVAPSTETLAYGGQTLTWDPEPPAWQFNTSALRWEHDGISYSLYGRGLTRDEALALFSSLRPLN